jgi:hypothetical protein
VSVPVNPDSVQIEKIKNGFLVRFEEAVPVDQSTPDQINESLERERDVQERARQAVARGDVEIAKRIVEELKTLKPTYRWKKTQLYCRNVKEIAKVLPEALMALILRESDAGAGKDTLHWRDVSHIGGISFDANTFNASSVSTSFFTSGS